jgi:hypothetical protein
MAVYFLRARHISRGKGGRVTRAAAYRARERILDERTSETHESHGPGPIAAESARAWIGCLERQASTDRSQSAAPQADEHGLARNTDGVQTSTPTPDRDHDFGL